MSFIQKAFVVKAGDGVDMRFLFKCFCGRRLKDNDNDQDVVGRNKTRSRSCKTRFYQGFAVR